MNRIQIHGNGPLGVTGELTVNGESMQEAWLCRCGASANKPFCDGSHKSCGFEAPAGLQGEAPAAADDGAGPLSMQTAPNGPILFKGAAELVDGDGAPIMRISRGALCRCGEAATKPFCDGAHKICGFEG